MKNKIFILRSLFLFVAGMLVGAFMYRLGFSLGSWQHLASCLIAGVVFGYFSGDKI
jgi:hypothetical protein